MDWERSTTAYGPGAFGRRGASQPAERVDLSDAARAFIESERAATVREAEIDFAIGGCDIQYVEVELDPGEAVIAENGAMIWKDSDVEMTLVLGDGADDNASVLGKAGAAARAVISGESFYLTEFRHAGAGRKARVALGGREIGQIVPIRLDTIGGSLVCGRGGFLAAAKGIRIGTQWQGQLAAGLLGGEGLVMQSLAGSGWVFLHVGGALIEKELAAGEVITVDSGCVAAHQPAVDLNVGFAGGIGVSIAGGEGILVSTMRGPGKVWIQSMPPKLARALNAPQAIGAGMLGGAATGLAEVAAKSIARDGLDIVRKLW